MPLKETWCSAVWTRCRLRLRRPQITKDPHLFLIGCTTRIPRRDRVLLIRCGATPQMREAALTMTWAVETMFPRRCLCRFRSCLTVRTRPASTLPPCRCLLHNNSNNYWCQQRPRREPNYISITATVAERVPQAHPVSVLWTLIKNKMITSWKHLSVEQCQEDSLSINCSTDGSAATCPRSVHMHIPVKLLSSLFPAHQKHFYTRSSTLNIYQNTPSTEYDNLTDDFCLHPFLIILVWFDALILYLPLHCCCKQRHRHGAIRQTTNSQSRCDGICVTHSSQIYFTHSVWFVFAIVSRWFAKVTATFER